MDAGIDAQFAVAAVTVTARAVSVPEQALMPLHVPLHPLENEIPKQTLTAFEQSGVQPGGVGAHGGPQ